MENKCPMCGAQLVNNVCGYCGYTSNVQNQPQPGGYSQQPQMNGGYQNYPPQQPQVTVNNVMSGNAGNQYVRVCSPKSKMTALILCILFGCLGAHKFYVGKAGAGLLYLFTCGLFGIGWLVDIISIATGSFKDSDGLPLKK